MVPFSLDCPLSIRVLTPEGWTPLEAAEGGYALARTALVELRQEEVYLTGWETPLLAVELVWPVQVAPGARVMGDAWERGYGDMGWRPLNGARALPWYFQLDEQGVQSAVGVKTQPAALASWYLDGAHLSLLLDTSVGPQGVRLRGRRLRLCQLSVCLNREQPSFSFACAFARTLCEAPRLAEQP